MPYAKDVRHIYESPLQVRACFPYGVEPLVERGEGKVIGLVVEEGEVWRPPRPKARSGPSFR